MLFRLLTLLCVFVAASLLLVAPFLVKGWRRKGLCLFGGLAAIAGYLAVGELHYQRLFDQVRTHHLRSLTASLDRYVQQQGHWPLAEAGKTVAVRLTDRPLPSHPARREDQPGVRYRDYTDLVAALQTALGADTPVPIDPQKAALTAPNWYLYRVDDTGYSLTAAFFFAGPCTRRVGFGDHRLTVGTRPNTVPLAELDRCLGASDHP